MLLEVNKLAFKHNNKKLLKDITFSVSDSEVITILGGSSSGKTLLFNHLIGYYPNDLNIQLNNYQLNKQTGKEYLKEIGFSSFLLKETVYEELAFPLKNLKYNTIVIRKRINYLLTKYDFIDYIYSPINTLSAYNLAKLKVLVAIVHKPKIIFLDEIYDYLGFKEYHKFNMFLSVINIDEKISIVKTSRKLEEALDSDKIILLSNGKIVLQGKLTEILKKDNELVKSGIKISPILDTSIQLKYYGVLDFVTINPDKIVRQLWN